MSTEAPLVSVLVPAFNVERYIGRALDSLTAQSFRDFEVFIIDDGSTDRTVSCIQPYLADERFHFIQQANAGVSAARNAALPLCRGDWVALLDADDEWAADKLEKQVEVIRAYPNATLIFSNGTEFSDKGDIGPFYKERRKFPEGDVLTRLMRGNCFWASSVLVRRRDATEVGMFQPGLAQDFDMWLRVLQRGGEARGVWEPVTRYRKRGDSLSSNKTYVYECLLRIYTEAVERSGNPSHKAILRRSIARTRSDMVLARFRRLLATGRLSPLQMSAQVFQAWKAFPGRAKVLRILPICLLGWTASVERALARKW